MTATIPSQMEPDVSRRRAVTLSFWALVVLCGVPYWWYSTSLERLPLPTHDIQHWVDKAPCFFRPSISIAARSFPPAKMAQLASDLQQDLAALPASSCLTFDIIQNPANPVPDAYEIQFVAAHDAPSIYGQRTAHFSASLADPHSFRQRLLETAQTLLHLPNKAVADPRVVKHSPKYKLAVRLLNQDSSEGEAVLEWDIHALLKNHLKPLLTSLSPLHSFEIETQIQYFAPLSVQVKPSSDGEGTTVAEAELKAFVDPAEWNIASPLSLDPVINLIVYVPSLSNRPMRIETSSSSPLNIPNAFLTPQWGGVVILNPPPSPSATSLNSTYFHLPFLLFQQHLHRLLGVPDLAGTDTTQVDDWQVDAMVRARLFETTRETVATLKAVVDLVNRQGNMPVGPQVLKGVQSSLAQLSLAESAVHTSPSLALTHTSQALHAASKAYYNPTMLPLLYFPDEHKYAIYTPLFAPVGVPLVVAALKEWREWRERRRRKRLGGSEEGEGREKKKKVE